MSAKTEHPPPLILLAQQEPPRYAGHLTEAISLAALSLRRAIPGRRPKGAAGFIRWSNFQSGLTEGLETFGWTAVLDSRFRIVSPDKSMVLAVATGNRRTGLNHEVLSGKEAANVAHAKKWWERYLQLTLPGIVEPAQELWVVLFKVDPESNKVRLEVSRPAEMSGGFVTRWAVRHPLGESPAKGPPPSSTGPTRLPAGSEGPAVDRQTPVARNVTVEMKRKRKASK